MGFRSKLLTEEGSIFENGFKLFNNQNALLTTVLKPYLSSFDEFKQSWNSLKLDQYLIDEGEYRLRRYSVFQFMQSQIYKLDAEPHLQRLIYNPLYGDIERQYKDWEENTYRNKCFQEIIAWIGNCIESDLLGWRIQAHQFRITAKGIQIGKPSPEGIHKDGADFALIMLINRSNVSGGQNSIFNNKRELIQQVTLSQPGDCVLLDDKAVYHYTTPIEADDYSHEAYRDTLVLTFHKPTDKNNS